jgi:glycerol-3-phosphate acyltransferase PlsY
VEFISNINVHFYLIAYLAGGIPFGLILAKRFGSIDIRQSGSGSIGATNVLRVLKESNPALAKKIAIATLCLDALKGVVVLIVAMMIGLSDQTLWMIALLAVLGHCYSPFLKLEGGKGVATSMGVMFFMLPIVTIIAIIAWFISGKLFKISSLSSLIALFTLLIASFLIYPDIPEIKTHAPIIIIAFLVFNKHIPNIMRIFSGKESKVV